MAAPAGDLELRAAVLRCLRLTFLHADLQLKRSGMSDQATAPQLTALNGVRFFAVFHIFLYHLWSTRYEADITKGEFSGVYAQLDSLPTWLSNFLAHGYLSTSFFFILSGFILAFLYWTPEGTLSTSNRQFWITRFSRIYPAHIIVFVITALLTVPRFFVDPSAPSPLVGAASALATVTLTHAWIAPLVPIFSWPTWALSAIVFLYLIMPWLMRVLARLTRKQQLALLIASPVISLIPTLIFLQFFPDGAADNVNWRIFIGSTPLFWVAQFVAGMLLARIFGLSRFTQGWRTQPKRWFALGDLALLALIAIALMEPHSYPWRHILRHGLLMPLYLLVIYDFALGRGFFARVFSLPGMNFLGQLSFSIFIWQNLLMMVSFIVVFVNREAAPAAFWTAVLGLLCISAVSTYFIEKPIASRLRRRFARRNEQPPLITAPAKTA